MRWNITCGDEYVDQITLGARLFFSIRIDFSSKEQKQAFQAKFSVSGPLFSVSGSVQEASKEFSRGSTVTVSALQLGGDVSKITSIFPNTTEGRSTYIQCTLGNFEECAKFLTSALAYATDPVAGFPSQISPTSKPGAAVLEYHTSKYTAAGLFP